MIEIIRHIDWEDTTNRNIAETLITDAKDYMRRVEAHIYKGNEIRADSYMDISEKQEEIRRLDRKRTEAHDRMLSSFAQFLDLLNTVDEFDENSFRLTNRTQIADFIASIVFELYDLHPESRIEGAVRDELAERLHRKDITYEGIDDKLHELASE